MMMRDPRLGAEPHDGENLRRIGRSLSGTVVTPRRSRLTATRSFVSPPLPALCCPRVAVPASCIWPTSRHDTHCFFSPVLFSHGLCVCCFSRFVLLLGFQSVLLSSASLLSPSKVKQADVSASPCLLPLF